MDRRQFLGSVLASSVATSLAVCVPGEVLAEGATDMPTSPVLRKAGTAHRASVTDFGADPTGREDSTAAVNRAIASMARTSARLVFPPGLYSFAASEETAMAFEGYDGLEIFGNGAELIFDGHTQPVHITHSRNIELHDLKFDWKRLPFLQGTVTQSQSGAFTVAIDAEYPVSGAEQVRAFAEYDPKAGTPAVNAFAEEGLVTAVRLSGPQVLQVELGRPASVREGKRLVLCLGGPERPVVHMQACEMILLESVALYAGPGPGVLLEGCRDISLEEVTAAPRPGSGRLLSVNRAGVQLVDCQGSVGVKRSSFRSPGSSAVAIHQSYWKIRRRIDDRTVLIEGAHGQALEVWQLPDVGSVLQLSDSAKLTLIGEIGLQKAENTLDGTKLLFKETLSPVIIPGTLVCNALAQPRTAIDHCTFSGGGNGVVVHGRTHITNSRFTGCADAAILLAADRTAMQGPTVQSVTVADNVFEHCNLRQGSAQRGTITVDFPNAETGKPGIGTEAQERVNQGINIQRNTFSNDGGPAIYCAAASWLTIEGNIFGPAGLPGAGSSPEAIVLRNVDQSFLDMNQSKTPQNIMLIGCTDKVQMTANVQLAEVRQG